MACVIHSRSICFLFVLFFFKQKTAYEMRISDWSSDVCSSDLLAAHGGGSPARRLVALLHRTDRFVQHQSGLAHAADSGIERLDGAPNQIGRESCRARVCQ